MEINMTHSKGEFDALMKTVGSKLVVLYFDSSSRLWSTELLLQFREMPKDSDVVYACINEIENPITHKEYHLLFLPTFILIRNNKELSRTYSSRILDIMLELMDLIERHSLLVFLFDDSQTARFKEAMKSVAEMPEEPNVIYACIDPNQCLNTVSKYSVTFLPTFILIKEKREAGKAYAKSLPELMQELMELIERHK